MTLTRDFISTLETFGALVKIHFKNTVSKGPKVRRSVGHLWDRIGHCGPASQSLTVEG